MQQRTDEWYQARLGIPTASRFDAVMAKGRGGQPSATRKNYMAELCLERLTGIPSEHYQSAAMLWGIENEDAAREAYEEQSGELVEDCGLIKQTSLNCGASPDGLIGDDGLLEIKCPNTAQHFRQILEGDYVNDYKWQLQGQLWITDREWVDFVTFDPRCPEEMQSTITRIKRDGALIEELSNQVDKFINELNSMETRLREKYAISK